MSKSKIATVEDKTGVWTGKVESKPHSIGDGVFGLLTAGVGFAALGTKSATTVVVNGERHTGRLVEGTAKK